MAAKSAERTKKSDAIINTFIFAIWAILVYSMYHDYVHNVGWRIIIWFGLLILSVSLYAGFKHLSPWTNFFVSITIFANILGELFLELFYSISLYDKILHFTIPFMMVFIIYDVFSPYFKKPQERLFYAVVVTAGLCILWEIAEIIFDYFFDAPMVGVFIKNPLPENIANSIEIMSPLVDTIYDVMLDAAGIFLAYVMQRRTY